MEVDEAEKQLLKGRRLLAGLEKFVTGDRLQVIRPLHVGPDALEVLKGRSAFRGKSLSVP